MKLTKAQQAALSFDKHLMIEAGPGSGKTTLIVERFVHILKTNPDLSPTQILAFTFTQKAAQEMETRVRRKLTTLPEWTDKPNEVLSIQTFHSFCSKMLHQFPHLVHVDPTFTVLPEEKNTLLKKEAIKTAIRSLTQHEDPNLLTYLDYFPVAQLEDHLMTCLDKRELFQRVSKNDLIAATQTRNLRLPDPNPMESEWTLKLIPALWLIYQTVQYFYIQSKTRLAGLDYTDLIEKTWELVQHEDVITTLQSQYPFVMVDEFQDTDPLQWAIIQKIAPLTQQKNNLCLVGDLKQSIYSFRGANADLFKQVMTDFSQNQTCALIHLAENFRSQPHLIEETNTLFSWVFGEALPYTPLVPTRTETTAEFALVLGEPDATQNWVLSAIKTELNKGRKGSDIAILARTKDGLSKIQSVLNRHHILNQTPQTLGFYHQDSIVFLLNLTQWILFPDNELALLGILAQPPFALTPDAIWALKPTPEHPLLKGLGTTPELTQHPHWPHLEALTHNIAQWQALCWTKPMGDALKTILKETQIGDLFSEDSQGAIPPFLQHLNAIQQQGLSPNDLVTYLWDQFHRNAAAPTQDPFLEDAVQLLTVHAAKGLEFPVVILVDADKGFNFSHMDTLIIEESGMAFHFPDPSLEEQPLKTDFLNTRNAHLIEEEKRLLFVASTRAKDALYWVGKPPKTKTKLTSPKSYWELFFTDAEFVSNTQIQTSFGHKIPIIQAGKTSDD